MADFLQNLFSIYTLMYLPLIFSCVISNRNLQEKVMWLFIILFSLFRGLRWEVGTDWNWYLRSFELIDYNNFYRFVLIDDDSRLKVLDIGWALLLLICKTIFNSYTAFLIISNFLILYLYKKIACLFSANPLIIFCLVICTANFFPVRQDLANVVFIYALSRLFITQGTKIDFEHLKKFIGYNIVAYSIHQTALMLTPMFLVKRLRIRRNTGVILLVFSFVSGVYVVNSIMPILLSLLSRISYSIYSIADNYLNNTENFDISSRSAPIFGFLLNLLFYIYFSQKLNKKNIFVGGQNDFKETPEVIISTLLVCFLIQMCLYQMFLSSVPVFTRISSYFGLITPILFGICYDNTCISSRKVFKFLFVIYCFYRFYKQFSFMPELHFPYQSVLSF